MHCAPHLPENWRALLERERAAGYPNTPKHQMAFRNFTQKRFLALPHEGVNDSQSQKCNPSRGADCSVSRHLRTGRGRFKCCDSQRV